MINLNRHLAMLMCCISVLRAQPQRDAKPAFEVASIKLNTIGRSPSTPPIMTAGDRFTTVDASLLFLLQFAFLPDGRRLRKSDVIGLPDWGDADGFDIQAKAESTGTPVSPMQMRQMVQSLLGDRFKLKTHVETREMPVFNLVAGDGALKLKRSETEETPTQRLQAVPSPSGAITLKLTSSGTSLAEVTNFLEAYVGRPVIDKTSMPGRFDIELQFAMESPSSTASSGSLMEPSGPSIFTAVREQLGFRLESSNGPVHVLVIDSVMKPSENGRVRLQ